MAKSVVELSSSVARHLGLSEWEIGEAAQVAVLHDVGKVAVPDHILVKPGPLTREELEAIRTHPVVGEQIVQAIDGLGHLAPVIRAGRERWDGRGYPDGLAGEEIPVLARIASACSAFEAMTSDRPYRPALPLARARDEVEHGAGTQFCPEAADALLAVVS